MESNKQNTLSQKFFMTFLLAYLMVNAPVVTQATEPYRIDWYTIDGGGGTSTGEPYTLNGTIGQPDADWCAGGPYELLGGFWPGGPVKPIECFPSDYSTYNDWVALGKPDCWCAPYQCDGDVDGVTSGFPFEYRVFNGDLALIVDNWRKKINDSTLNPCADIDHKDSGFPFYYRVFNSDLSRIVTNWRKKDTDLLGDCPRSE